LGDADFPPSTCKSIEIGGVVALASRISYVGESGWELHAPMEEGLNLWDAIWQAGQPYDLRPVGIGVYATTARLEKCYRAIGAELESEYTVVEAGLQRPLVKKHHFIGKEAYLHHRAEEPAAILCTLTFEPSGELQRYPLGREPVLTAQGDPIVDRKGRRSYVTSAGSGPSVGKHIMLAYLPPAEARVGNNLLVEYFSAQHPVTVEVVGKTPLFDPENQRLKG
jgi:glycine cleavage system aminomethyltransferase T